MQTCFKLPCNLTKCMKKYIWWITKCCQCKKRSLKQTGQVWGRLLWATDQHDGPVITFNWISRYNQTNAIDKFEVTQGFMKDRQFLPWKKKVRVSLPDVRQVETSELFITAYLSICFWTTNDTVFIGYLYLGSGSMLKKQGLMAEPSGMPLQFDFNAKNEEL